MDPHLHVLPTHHLIFADDADGTIWTSSGGAGAGVLGWLKPRVLEQTGDEARAQGWTPFIVDSNGNGRRDAEDRRLSIGLYSVAVNPKDGSVGNGARAFPQPCGARRAGIRPDQYRGYGDLRTAFSRLCVRGGDIDRNGVFWASFASGHLGNFDRRKCKGPLNGPQASGKHCPEGWTLYRFPGPQFRDVQDDGSVEASYYVWVDWFNSLGLGENVPIATGNMNEAYLALVDGKFVTLRVPYLQGFFAKWAEGRIDDPATGWRGRGLWATYSTRAVFHSEGGTGSRPRVVKFQLRSD